MAILYFWVAFEVDVDDAGEAVVVIGGGFVGLFGEVDLWFGGLVFVEDWGLEELYFIL